MKFRIKILTRNNGDTTYTPEVYIKSRMFLWGYWKIILSNGNLTTNPFSVPLREKKSRENALDVIDNYIYLQNYKPHDIKSIEFQYLHREFNDIDVEKYRKKHKKDDEKTSN